MHLDPLFSPSMGKVLYIYRGLGALTSSAFAFVSDLSLDVNDNPQDNIGGLNDVFNMHFV